MPKFRNKPVVIEAIQFNGANHLLPQTPFMQDSDAYLSRQNFTLGEIVIPTINGDIRARAGDWIIKDVNGEFSTCKPDVFESRYELVEENKSL